MSLYQPESQLSRLNRDGALRQPHPYVVEVLRQAQAMSERSAGAFDVTVQPLWEALAAASRAGKEVDDAVWAAARELVDFRRLTVGDEEIRLSRPGMRVTLNGIAQGYAADRVRRALAERGIEHALFNTGEIGGLGESAAGDPWRIGIQHPRQSDAYAALAQLDGRALATSGDYATRLPANERRHHLFDPRSGRTPSEVASVSVIAPSATAADALSTTLFVLGVEAGLTMLRDLPDVDAFFVLPSGETVATAGFPLIDEEAAG